MTNSESSRLIAETLRLDGEATQGPWRQGRLASYDAITGEPERFVYRGDGESGTTRLCIRGGEGEDGAVFDCDADASAIVAYRTSAPRLARIAKMQSEAMAWIGGDGPKPSWFAEAIKREPRRNYGDIDMQVISRYVLAEIEKIARDGA